ncbi:hypothetical protein CLV59_105119 [Chitinophaga dinghuensis]|uniref:YCII-related domain-containing protein n=1 Tax=Chitinophaga dinghuensis TaxID=1539050 RepID=A0A327VX15_9BACT|nr:hypothetical protein [Chitinophaga dinghuensis]RAJ80012.1 hypothetical protein CLV59_105119 [Chitinophaga dinghuensis]
MKEYVFFVRINPESLSASDLETLHAGWDTAVEHWKAGNHYIYGIPVVQPGFVVDDHNSAAGVIREEGNRLVSFIHMSAENDEQAMQLASMAPVLQFGGSIEIRIPQRTVAPVYND